MIDSYSERVAEAHAKLRAEIEQQQELLEEFQEKSSALLAKSLEQNKEIERLRAALDECCEVVETRPQVGRSIEYANGFRVGAQCQRLLARVARDKALKEKSDE